MGYAVIMFVIMLLLAVSIALSANYGITKDAQEAPLLAENAYAEHEAGKMQTDIIIYNTKINGTAKYTYPDSTSSPKYINLHLNIINNGSIVLDPSKYSIILNRSWVPLSRTSNNVTAPLENSTISSINLSVTPVSAPMKSLSLLVTTENGVKIITPTSPMIRNSDISTAPGDPADCYWNLTITWQASYGEVWPIKYYTLYYMKDNGSSSEIINKNPENVTYLITDDPTTTSMIGNLFPKGSCKPPGSGNPSYYVWISATDVHGNEGPPSNTCKTSGSNGVCNNPT